MIKQLPSGIELMRDLVAGDAQQPTSAYVEEVRRSITEGCEELIEIGARIRPLMDGEEQIGWIRGIHLSERKLLQRWYKDRNELLLQTLLLGTTLSREQLQNLSSYELRSLGNTIQRMDEADISLFPYISPFVTTSVSENLWFSKGREAASYSQRMIPLPEGREVKVLCPPDHARLWATLCAYRETSKQRLEEYSNAVLLVRAQVGSKANALANEVQRITKSLKTDILEPWTTLVKTPAAKNPNDGWAHPDDTPEGMERELRGMLNNDRHERVIDRFYEQQVKAAEEQQRKVEQAIKEHGGLEQEDMVVVSEAEVLRREREIRAGHERDQARIAKLMGRSESEENVNPHSRLKKYE